MTVASSPPSRAGRQKRRATGACNVRVRRSSSNRRRVALRERLPSAVQLVSALRGLIRQSLPMFLALFLLSGAAWGSLATYRWMTHASRFAIHEISLSGNRHLGLPEIEALLDLPPEANIFLTDTSALESKLLVSPWIRTAQVSRDLPSSLEIVVKEEQAVAAAQLGGLYLLNAEGELFKRASLAQGDIDGLSIVTGMSRESLSRDALGCKIRFKQALEALTEYQSNSDRPRIGEVHLDERHGLSLITYEDAIGIHLGTPSQGQIASRLRVFDAAWQALDDEEHAAVRSFRIADHTPSDRVTVAFAEN